MTNGVFAQFLVLDRRAPTQEAIAGLLLASGANPYNGHAFISAVRFLDGLSSTLRFMEGAGLFFDYLFMNTDFRKLYMETSEVAGSLFKGALRTNLFVEEGRLRKHVFINGEYVDQMILALYRDEWIGRRDRFLKLVSPMPVSA